MDPAIQEYYDQITTAVERILAAAEGLDAEGLNWKPIPDETRSLCILNVHIVGNIRQGILSVLCGQPDNRDRDAEFAATCDSFEELQASWNQLKSDLHAGMSGLTTDDLQKDYVHPRRGPMNGWTVLLNTAVHANEHVGHAELTRQLWEVRGRD
ncbi:MAG TPA: DinB family protein [Thermomicrobiales bacterium]|nr:DinB family protein [Thermomicrobiales bacterium]